MTSRSTSVFPYFFPLGHTTQAVGIVQVRMSVIEPQWVKDVNGQEKAMQDISCKSPYYAIRAYVRDHGAAKRRGRENGIHYAGALRRRVYPPHLYPCHPPEAGGGRQNHGQLHGAGDVTAEIEHSGSAGFYVRRSCVVSGSFPVWVRLWVLTVSRKRKPPKSLCVKGQLWVKKEMKCGSGICQKSLENGENQEIFTVFWSY